MLNLKQYLPLTWRCAAIMAIALVLGLIIPVPPKLVDSVFGLFQRKIDLLVSQHYVFTALRIAANNILASGVIMFLAFLYRPIGYYMLAVNGFIMGVAIHSVLGTAAAQHLPWMLLYTWLEIPALIFCTAVGAYHTRSQGGVKREGGALVSTHRFTYAGFGRAMVTVLRACPIAVGAFVVAGFLEAWVALNV